MISSVRPTAGNDVRVEVIRAWPHRFESVRLDLPEGSRVKDAVMACGLEDADQAAAFAVFGVVAAPETALNEGDRVELLRPLSIDPKEARRRRARK